MEFDGSKDLIAEAKEAADALFQLNEPVRVVAHYDCDGISSAVIVHEALTRADIPFEITFVEELDRDVLQEVKEEAFERVYLFVDIGSGQIDAIMDVLPEKEVFIADHHDPGEGQVAHHVNPHRVGIDGGEHISGAGVTYLVMRMLSDENQDLVQYALVGATGDIQTEGERYLGLNEELMEDAMEQGVVEKRQGLKLFGRSGKSIVKALMYTTDPYLPGISNNEAGTVRFLSDTGLNLRADGDWRSLSDLSLEEEKQLIHALLTEGYDVGSLLGNVYMLENGWEISEFASLMNACGRMGRPHDGIRICLEEDFDLAFEVKRDYGRKISTYLSYVEDNEDEVVNRIEGGGAIITGGDRIHYTMIGTITTICQKSDILTDKVLVGMAHKEEDRIKLSARARPEAVEAGLKMNEIMDELCTVCDGDGGGHEAAAGGTIPRAEEDRFIKLLREVLEAEA